MSCVDCGRPIVVTINRMATRKRIRCHACSPSKAQSVQYVCVVCAKPFTSFRFANTCGKPCWHEYAKAQMRQYWYDVTGTDVNRQQAKCLNPKCGAEFTRGLKRKFCSPQCKIVYRNINRPGKSVTVRIRKFGTARVEKFKRIEIFERDNWTCKLCGLPALKKHMGIKHPFAPTIDHKIPLSKGGNHTRRNVQCAHFKCNLAKGNK